MPDNKLISSDGRTTAQLQNDGNFVIYTDGVPIWSSKTSHLPPSQPEPPPPDPLPLPPVEGRRRGDFLYPYFGPAYMSWAREDRLRQLDAMAARGALDILIMAQWIFRSDFTLNGWAGPRGFDFRNSQAALAELVETIREARQRGMRVSVKVWDRGSGASIHADEDRIVEAVRVIYNAASDVIEMISPAFEIEEGRFGPADQVRLFQRLRAVAPNVRLAAHYTSTPTEGVEHWRNMRDAGVTDFWAQYDRADSLGRLADLTRRWVTMLPAEVSFTSFEHSAPAGFSAHTEAERQARWQACGNVLITVGRPAHSFNAID